MRADQAKFDKILQIIQEEMASLEFISASPTRAGRYIQVRVRCGKRTGRHTFYQPIPKDFSSNQGMIKHFLTNICAAYTKDNYSIVNTPMFQNLIEDPKVQAVYKQAYMAACEQTENCSNQHHLSQRMKAKKALKSWILLAYDHDMKDAQLVELFNECRAEHVLRS